MKKYLLPGNSLYFNKKSNNIVKNINSIKMNNHYNNNNNNNKYINSLPFYLSSISFNDKALTSIFTLSSVYTDWNHFNINPFNIFRSFKYKNLNINKLLTDSNDTTINELLNINCEYASFNSLNLNQLPYWAHPLEYNSIPLYQYINGYNLLLYFSSINNDEHLNYILSLYKTSLKKIGFKFIFKYSIKYKFLITPFNFKILVGTFITNKILNNSKAFSTRLPTQLQFWCDNSYNDCTTTIF